MLICPWLCMFLEGLWCWFHWLYTILNPSPHPQDFQLHFATDLHCTVSCYNQQEVDYKDFYWNKTDVWEGTNFQRPVNLWIFCYDNLLLHADPLPRGVDWNMLKQLRNLVILLPNKSLLQQCHRSSYREMIGRLGTSKLSWLATTVVQMQKIIVWSTHEFARAD